MSTATATLTAEEFALLPETGMQRSLIRGEVVEAMPPNARHGIVVGRFFKRLIIWADDTGAGVAGVESGFILARDPDIVRGPDAYFVRADRIPPDGVSSAFWDLTPNVAVEIVSPSETANAVREKVQDYLAAGTALVVVIYPQTRELVAHTPDDLARTFRTDDTFTAPDVLPGFTCRVAELFA